VTSALSLKDRLPFSSSLLSLSARTTLIGLRRNTEISLVILYISHKLYSPISHFDQIMGDVEDVLPARFEDLHLPF
jgi:hypothetical protein